MLVGFFENQFVSVNEVYVQMGLSVNLFYGRISIEEIIFDFFINELGSI